MHSAQTRPGVNDPWRQNATTPIPVWPPWSKTVISKKYAESERYPKKGRSQIYTGYYPNLVLGPSSEPFDNSAYESSITGTAGGYDGNFASKLASSPSGLVTGPLDLTIYRRKLKPGYYKYAHYLLSDRKISGQMSDFVTVAYHSGYGGGVLPLESVVSSARNKALRRFLNKYNQERKLLAAALAAEATKTGILVGSYVDDVVGLFRSSAARIESFLNGSIRRFRRRPPSAREYQYFLRKLGDRSAEEWLKLKFGIEPLVRDLQGLAQASHRRFQRRDLGWRTFRSVDSDESSIAVATAVQVSSYGEVWGNDWRSFTRHVTIKYRAAIKADFSAPQLFGTSVRDIPATLYELLPWSWLLDYVSNAGILVDSFGQFYGLPALVQETVVSREIKRAKRTPYSVPVTTAYKVMFRDVRSAYGTVETTRISRRVVNGIPLPTFELQNNMSLYKGSLLAAVAWQMQKKVHLQKLQYLLIRQG